MTPSGTWSIWMPIPFDVTLFWLDWGASTKSQDFFIVGLVVGPASSSSANSGPANCLRCNRWKRLQLQTFRRIIYYRERNIEKIYRFVRTWHREKISSSFTWIWKCLITCNICWEGRSLETSRQRSDPTCCLSWNISNTRQCVVCR